MAIVEYMAADGGRAADDVRRLPIVDANRPVGIVSLGDLAIERDEDSVLADISSEPANN